jgi:hypothetical protein
VGIDSEKAVDSQRHDIASPSVEVIGDDPEHGTNAFRALMSIPPC